MPQSRQSLGRVWRSSLRRWTIGSWTIRFLALAILVGALAGTGCIVTESEFRPAAPSESRTALPNNAAPAPTEKAGLPDSREPEGAERVAEIPATLKAVAQALEDAAIGQPPELQQLREYLLGLINRDRQAQGLPPVELGNNPASQFHAEEMQEQDYISHWDTNGLKPYMRYTLAGGTDYEAENVSRQALFGVGVGRSLEAWLDESQEGLMNSPGHRRNILNQWHKKVNLGIACTQTACSVVQQFQGDYMEFQQRPYLADGVLSFAGSLKEGFSLEGVQVWYDQPPHPLTLGQLDQTYSYGTGQYPVSFLRQPLTGGYYYTDASSHYTWETGVDPYLLDPETPRAEPVCEDNICSGLPKPPATEVSLEVPWVTAEVWETNGSSFRLVADLSPVVDALGAGVYTVIIWGQRDGESVALTRYALFVE